MALRLGLTPGCPRGVGPELLARALADMTDELDGVEQRIFAPADDVDHLTAQRDALLAAIDAAARGEVDAIVTGPVRKKALVVNGRAYPGQTELVHERLRDDDGPPLMVFAGAPFVLGLHTVHIGLAEVSSLITRDGIMRSVRRLAEAATAMVGVTTPRVVVLGVNPHAGEGGMFGREEIDVVSPALDVLRGDGVDVVGPIPADGFFADVARGRVHDVHAVLAMHHDQGLAPYKLLVGGEGVNITWGVTVPRTSPDHGTADALVGTGKADPASTKAAIRMAVLLARARAVDAT